MNEMEQSEYSVMFDSLDGQDLLKRLKRLEQNIRHESDKINRKTKHYYKLLSSQYDLLFGPQVYCSRHHKSNAGMNFHDMSLSGTAPK